MRPLPITLVFIYFLSGLTGLAYEILWARQLGLVFGASNFGIVITVAAFMAGLGLGSLAASRFAFLVSRPLLVFALLEFSIGVFAFNLPGLLAGADSWATSAAQGASMETWYILQGVVLFLLFCLPATVLGVGFPIFLSACKSEKISLSTVYGVNTIGGVAGCFIPLLLLPVFGWTVSVRLIALMSFFIAIICLVAHFSGKKLTSEIRPARGDGSAKSLIMYALIGAMALVVQIAWTRIYGMLLLRTEYVVALLIASFLVGIALGAVVSRWMRADYWRVSLPLFVASGVLISLMSLPWVAQWAEQAQFASLSESLATQAILIFVITIPATFAFGAWLPLLAGYGEKAHQNGAILYAANSIGAAIGALLAGFVLMPLIGTPSSLVFAMTVVLLVAMYWIKSRWYKTVAIVLPVISVGWMAWPSVTVLLPAAHAKSIDLSVYENALAVTQVVQNDQGHRFLLSDLQRMDASTEPTAITVQRIQGMLPVLLADQPASALFLGLGTGITSAGALPFEGLKITAIELSAGAIKAAGNEFVLANDSVVNKIEIINDDARRFVKSDANKYSVIVGDLFHPDLVGRGALLSLQQFERVKNRLEVDGVFVQWVALNQFDVGSLKIILKTFKEVFPEAQIFVDGFRLALVGTDKGINGNTVLARQKVEDERVFAGEDAWSWLGRYWGRIPDFGVAIQDEWAPVIEYSIPEARFANRIDLRKSLSFLLKLRPSGDKAVSDLHLHAPADIERFSRAYDATGLIYASWLAKLNGDEGGALRLLEAAFAANPMDRWIGFEMADRMFASLEQASAQGLSKQQALMRILELRPDHMDALGLLWRLEMAAGNFDNADDIKARLVRLNPYDPKLGDG